MNILDRSPYPFLVNSKFLLYSLFNVLKCIQEVFAFLVLVDVVDCKGGGEEGGQHYRYDMGLSGIQIQECRRPISYLESLVAASSDVWR